MPNLVHRHGGTITAITGVGHSTHRGVAEWFYYGNVTWDDGTAGDNRAISPLCLCHDGTPESEAEVRRLNGVLNDYLLAAGHWHEQKSKRDGRVYSWTPKEPTGRVPVMS